MAFITSNSRWTALQSRDPAAANAFIYSVRTTKIYCRPTCPSRLARRSNIVYHDTAEEAEADGYRACKRCRPNLSKHEGDSQILAVRKICRILQEEPYTGVKLSVKELAARGGMTESHFCRVFKKLMGVTIGGFRKTLNAPDQSPSPERSSEDEIITPSTSNGILNHFADVGTSLDSRPSALDIFDEELYSSLHPPYDTWTMAQLCDCPFIAGPENIFDATFEFVDFER